MSSYPEVLLICNALLPWLIAALCILGTCLTFMVVAYVSRYKVQRSNLHKSLLWLLFFSVFWPLVLFVNYMDGDVRRWRQRYRY